MSDLATFSSDNGGRFKLLLEAIGSPMEMAIVQAGSDKPVVAEQPDDCQNDDEAIAALIGARHEIRLMAMCPNATHAS